MSWDYNYAMLRLNIMEAGFVQNTLVDKDSVVPTELTFQPDQPSCLYPEEGGIPFRGQDSAKALLRIHIDTLGENERLKTLLSGAAGTGKTTLAWIIASRIQARRRFLGQEVGRFFEVLPSQMATKKDLDVFMRQLKPYDIVFVDEIHILKANVGAEPLYHTLDDTGTPRYPLSNGEGWLDIPTSVSWLGATTEPGELDDTTGGALRRRLAPEIVLEAPSNTVLVSILEDQPFGITMKAAAAMAHRSGGLPWQVLSLYGTARKLAMLDGKNGIDYDVATETFKILGVDEHGLFSPDRTIIRILMQSPYKMRGTGEIRYKMSETALCSASGIDKHTYHQIVQPRLMRLGFLTTVGGQCLTPKAVETFNGYLQ